MTKSEKKGDEIPVFNGGNTGEVKEKAPEKKSRLDLLVEREKRKKFL
jgi:hypothetical protein